MGSRHRPGTVRGLAGDRPHPFALTPAIQLLSHSIKVRTRAKSKVWIETRELRLSSRECDFPGINIPSYYGTKLSAHSSPDSPAEALDP